MAVKSPRAPLVGREAELERLDAPLAAPAAEGEGGLAIAGGPGVGKTRLLAELRERAETAGHLVLGGAAAEFERDLPFSVWVDALDAYVSSQDLDLDPALAAELGGILPSLRSSAPAPLADERFRAHRAVR